jgi:hypothetical protein
MKKFSTNKIFVEKFFLNFELRARRGYRITGFSWFTGFWETCQFWKLWNYVIITGFTGARHPERSEGVQKYRIFRIYRFLRNMSILEIMELCKSLQDLQAPVIPSAARDLPAYHRPLGRRMLSWGRSGGRFLDCARSCLACSARNDGGAVGGGGRRGARCGETHRRASLQRHPLPFTGIRYLI